MTEEENFQKVIQDIKKPLSINEFKSLCSTCTIIDTRIEAQNTGLIKASYWFPSQPILSSWLATFISPDQPYLCVCDRSEVDSVLERFILMGYCNCVGYNNFEMKHFDGEMEYPLLRNWQQLGDAERKQFVDVRTPVQWNKTGVPKKAILIQLNELDRQTSQQLTLLKKIQKSKLIILICKSGQRTKLASSILFRHNIFNISLMENIEDFPKLGIKMQTVEQNQQYWQTKKDRLDEISSQDENKVQKQLESDNMNRMAVEECYEECLKKHPEKSPEECRQQCANKQQPANPNETIKLQHSFNRNQFQASKQHILPSKAKTYSQLYKKAISNFSSQKFHESLNQWNELISKSPQNSQFYINRALCQFELGDIQSAQSDLQKAIEIDQGSFGAYFNLASLKISQKKDFQSKLDALENIKKSLSCLYVQKYRKAKDQNDIVKALSLNSQNKEALIIKGFGYCERGNLSQAMKCLSRVNEVKSSENEKIAQLCQRLREKMQREREVQKQENPEVEKRESEPLKAEPSKSESIDMRKERLDEEIKNRVKEWNKVYRDVYEIEGPKMKKIESKHRVWIID